MRTSGSSPGSSTSAVFRPPARSLRMISISNAFRVTGMDSRPPVRAGTFMPSWLRSALAQPPSSVFSRAVPVDVAFDDAARLNTDEGGCASADLSQLGIKVPARTGGLESIPVTRNALEILIIRKDRAGGRNTAEVELPGEEPLVRIGHGLGNPCDIEVADGRDARGPPVVVQGLGADDRLVHPAEATLPGPAEAVDQEVVPDVVPTQALHVIGVDATDHLRHLARGVRVGADGVLHEGELHLPV